MVQGVMAVRAFLILLAVTALSGPVRANPTGPEHTGRTTAECLACHGVGEFGMAWEDGQWISLFVDEKEFLDSVHGTQECSACHRDMAEGGHRRAAIGDATLQAAVKALKDMPMNQPIALASCVICHETEFEQYRDSVHGQAALAGNADVPVCTDCHGDHYIKAVENLESSVYPSNVPATCAHCHADSTVMAKHDIDRNVYETYDESFHGVRAGLGSLRVAVCTSCHGVHDILALSDRRSKLHPTRRAAACRECHEDATDEFALSFTHRPVTRATSPIVYWIGEVYTWFIYVTIGAMAAYVVLDVLRWLVSILFARAAGASGSEATPLEPPIARWDCHQVLQHGLLMVSFTALVFTGMPLRVPNALLSRYAIALVGGADNAGLLHRIAAVVLILTAVYHVAYLLRQRARGHRTTAILPAFSDVRDLLTMLLYFFGLSRTRARFGRYSFAEKFEYWAVAWGSAIMMATGAILWLPGLATRVLPAVILDIGRVIHGYEAILAALAILVWHFYHVHLHPARFPMNWTWVTGRMSAGEMREFHPLEYEAVMRKRDTRDCPDHKGVQD